MPCSPEAQAEVVQTLEPRAPVAMEIWPAAMLAIMVGMKKGEMRDGPCSRSLVWVASRVSMPPMPQPTMTETSSASSAGIFQPASSMSIMAADRA